MQIPKQPPKPLSVQLHTVARFRRLIRAVNDEARAKITDDTTI